MRLVSMPSNSDTGIVFSAKNLFYLRGRAAMGFDFLDHRRQPLRHLHGCLKPLLRVVVFEAEPCDAPLALKRAELKRHQRKSANPLDEIELHRRCDDLGIISKTWQDRGPAAEIARTAGSLSGLFPPHGLVRFGRGAFRLVQNLPVAWLRFVDGHHRSRRWRFLIEEERNRAKNVPLLGAPVAQEPAMTRA